MMTVRCKGYTAKHDADGITLEILEPTPADLIPVLIRRADAASKLAVSARHFDALCERAGIRPVDGLPIRYRQEDLIPLTKPRGEAVPQSTPTPQTASKSASGPAKITRSEPATNKPRPKTKLRVD